MNVSLQDKMHTEIRDRVIEMRELFDYFFSDDNIRKIVTAAVEIGYCLFIGNKVISCGNGGSMSDAMHFAEEFSARFRGNRRSLPAMAASDPAYLTCAANDFGYEHVFERFVQGFGNEGDVLLAISTSGKSQNVILAAKAAKEKDMKVIGLTGKDGGELGPLCDVEIRVPHLGYADRIQEIHIKVIHLLVQYVEMYLKLDSGE